MKLNTILLPLLLFASCKLKTNESRGLDIDTSKNKEVLLNVDRDFQLNIDISNDYAIKEVYNIQLSKDSSYVNQIVLVQKNGEDFLRVMFVDAKLTKNLEYSENEDSYFLSWEEKLLSTNVKDLTFYSLDLEGDGNTELIFIGKDKEGNSVINLFRKNGRKYYMAFSKVVDGVIKIEENENKKNNFEIAVYQGDKLETYSWNAELSAYKSRSLKNFKNTEIDKEKKLSIFNNLWIKKGKDYSYILEFNKESMHVSVMQNENGNKMEGDYKIVNYIDLRGRYIFFLENEFISLIVDKIDFYLTKNGANISFQKETKFNGSYKKLNINDLVNFKKENKEQKIIELNGLYSNNEGLNIIFSNSTFTIRDGKKNDKGTYIIYKLNKDIIDFQTTNKKKIERKTYIISFEKEKNDNIIIKKIKLTPAKILASGAYENGNKALYLEQITILDKNKN